MIEEELHLYKMTASHSCGGQQARCTLRRMAVECSDTGSGLFLVRNGAAVTFLLRVAFQCQPAVIIQCGRNALMVVFHLVNYAGISNGQLSPCVQLKRAKQ